jgi:hypothetical protein
VFTVAVNVAILRYRNKTGVVSHGSDNGASIAPAASDALACILSAARALPGGDASGLRGARALR